VVDGIGSAEAGALETDPATRLVVSATRLGTHRDIYLSPAGPADYRILCQFEEFSTQEAAALISAQRRTPPPCTRLAVNFGLTLH